MSTQTNIEWTDSTWNPTTGCTKISPGCAHCYIEHTPPFRIAGRKFVRGHIPLQLHHDRLEQPLTWRHPRRVFVDSLSDLFHEEVPDEFIDQAFAVMALARGHTFQILTKRADRMHAYVTAADRWGAVARWLMAYADPTQRRHPIPERQSSPSTEAAGQKLGLSWPLRTVWLGVTVENQPCANERIPLLLQTPAAVRFISAEPLLAPVDLRRITLGVQRTFGYGNRWIEWDALTGWEHQWQTHDEADRRQGLPRASCSGPERRLQWVIVGGESGRGARPCEIAWVRSIQAQCRAAHVPCFVKQLGSNPVGRYLTKSACDDHPLLFRDRKGGDPADWPDDLRVRQYPK